MKHFFFFFFSFLYTHLFQDAHELFQIISSVLTSEEEIQYRENATSLLDAATIRGFTVGENVSFINKSLNLFY